MAVMHISRSAGQRSPREGRAFCIASLLAAISCLLLVRIATAPSQGGTVAVFVAPWAAPGHAVRVVVEAGGRVVRQGGWANVVVATSDEPGWIGRLYAAGA